MRKSIFTDFRTLMLSGIGTITLFNYLVSLFGQTIPNIIWSFFRDVGLMIIVAAVFIFAIAWLLKLRPPNRPKNYLVIIFDVFGNETKIDGLRTDFKTHDVAWSYMKQYKKSYPIHNFALVSEVPKLHKKTIFKYI